MWNVLHTMAGSTPVWLRGYMDYRHDLRHYGDDFGAAMGGSIMLLMAACLVVGVWLIVKAIDLVIRTLSRYPTKRVLWIALAIPLACFSLAGVVASYSRGTDQLALNITSGLCALGVLGLLVLLVICRVVEVRNQDLFSPEKDSFVNSVLRKPWWGNDNAIAS